MASARVVTTVAVAALIGTVVGGASAVSVVMAVMQPPHHDMSADAGSGGTPLPSVRPLTDPQPAAPAQAQVAPPVKGPRGQSATKGPSATWPDALSARSDHAATDGAPAAVAAAAPTPPSPPQSSPAAAADSSDSRQLGDQTAAQTAAQDGGAPASEQNHGAPTGSASVAERAPWPTPVSPAAKAARKHAGIGSEESAPPPRAAEPTAPQPAVAASTATAPAGTATNKTRSEPRKSRLVEQQQGVPDDDAARSGDDRDPVAVPPPQPRQRVIIVPAPQQRDASMDRDHWDRGPVRLFDFFGGGDHWNDNRSGNGNDRWGWHDDDRD
jgi:hypothetical protein